MKKPKIIELIKDQVLKEVESEWRPDRIPGTFRGSEVGDCPRAIQYAVEGVRGNTPNAELALLFADGHLHHDALRQRLRSIGTVTNVEWNTSRRFSVPLGNEHVEITLSGTFDLIFDKDYIIDIKSINMFSFKWLMAKGEDYFREKFPHYIDQIQVYLELANKEWGAILFKCKNSSALQIFWIKRDPERFQRILRKLAKIHRATLNGKKIKKPYDKASHDECEICPYRQPCWGRPPKEREWK